MHLRPLAIPGICALVLAGCATPGAPKWTPLLAADLSHPLSLADCLNLAQKSDVRAAQWQARMDLAAADLKAARTPPNPSFQVSWEDLGIKDAAGTALSNGAYNFSYPIFFWVARGKQVAAAKKKIEAEQFTVQADHRQLQIEIGAAYFALLADIHKEKSGTALLDQARENLRLAEEQLKLGAASGHDFELAKAESLQAELDLFDARQQARARRLAFAFALGADRPLSIEIVESALRLPEAMTVATAQDLAAPSALPDSLLTAALDSDPTFAAARAIRQAAEAQFQLEVRRRIPFTETRFGGSVKDAPEGLGHNFNFEMPIPIFDWNQAGVKRARADLLAAQAQEEAARRTTAATLEQNWSAFSAAWTRYSTYSKQIATARERLANDARDLFAAGQIGYLELTQARSEWRKAEVTAADAWLSAMTSAWNVLCRTEGKNPEIYVVASEEKR